MFPAASMRQSERTSVPSEFFHMRNEQEDLLEVSVGAYRLDEVDPMRPNPK